MSRENEDNTIKSDNLHRDSECSSCNNGQRESLVVGDDLKESVTRPSTSSPSQSVKKKFNKLTFGFKKKTVTCANKCKDNGKKKNRSSGWGFKLCARTDSCADVAESTIACNSCVCTGYKRTEEHHLGSGVVFDANSKSNNTNNRIDICKSDTTQATVNSNDTPDESAHIVNDPNQSNLEMYSHAEHNNILNNYHAANLPSTVISSVQVRVSELALALRNQLALTVSPYPYLARWGEMTELTPGFLNRFCIRGDSAIRSSNDVTGQQQIHTQIDYIHCLVPDLLAITNCSFYWGKMDRYDAEKLLENKPEGTFLLRDSAQEEHLFSVSFRRFDRSLHARIEQWNHRFSFDSHDPGVFASSTVCGLIEHYKDPSHCMFFEPMLTIPLHRNFPFSLQHLSRVTICSRLTYDSIHQLQLPKRLKNFLKEYHYKQQVRVRRLDGDH